MKNSAGSLFKDGFVRAFFLCLYVEYPCGFTVQRSNIAFSEGSFSGISLIVSLK